WKKLLLVVSFYFRAGIPVVTHPRGKLSTKASKRIAESAHRIDHHLILWNRACEFLTGISKEQALAKPVDSGIFYQGQIRPILADVVLDTDEKAMLKLYGDKNLSRSPSIPEAFEAQDLLTIRGVQKNVSFLAARIRDSEGKVIGAIETIHDITEREQLYRQLLHSQKMEAIGRLAGGVAHDFNNLLVIIRGYSEFLLSRLDEQAPMRKEIEVIKATGDRAASLTRQLLAFSRKQMLHPKILDLNKLVVDMEKMLRRLISEDIELATDLGADIERVKADPGQIEQVIMNLVINARDAMPGGGKVTIKTENVALNQGDGHLIAHEKSGRFVCLSVADTGIGMDKKLLDKVFEPFFSTKGPAKGTGLGLSTVYGIIEQHGGWVNIQSELEKGSTFWIYLPALAIEIENEPEGAASLPNYQGNGERILLVEDEKEVRIFAAKMLHESGYEVFQAKDAEEAVHIFHKENGNFHLIFSDVVLPGKNGLELVDQLLSRQSRIKVLFTSGYADDKSQWPLIRERNYCFLKKPYDLGSLLRNVREALDSSKWPAVTGQSVRTTGSEE
ncbi:MAG: ATP-binding protein, partial [bacterium]